MSLDAAIQKIPRPVLIIGVLVLALAFFVYQEPLKDECGIQGEKFKKNMTGTLFGFRTQDKKTQYPKINFWSDRCRRGNSIGSCSEYFEGLRVTVRELKNVSEKCQLPLFEANPALRTYLQDAVRIIPLVAWGEVPPKGLSERMGWLNESDVRTFCYLKNTYTRLLGEERYLAVRESVYREYPGEWPENFDINAWVSSKAIAEQKKPEDVDVTQVVTENRPRAYKTAANSSGVFNKDEIYERSLFSIRCDLYM